ncbi:unnamed protein product [Caenorhabditis bovis]|uniref:Protein kinase domain-containing protein n=1 Tax=Caenorhabditis bovis TaxID=2654633 RepID=A0A8S1FAR4_9PELO|nr:unnamed protein product [Caenorhabditis bovis]
MAFNINNAFIETTTTIVKSIRSEEENNQRNGRKRKLNQTDSELFEKLMTPRRNAKKMKPRDLFDSGRIMFECGIPCKVATTPFRRRSINPRAIFDGTVIETSLLKQERDEISIMINDYKYYTNPSAEIFPKIRLQKKISNGQFCEVFIAQWNVNDKKIAVKRAKNNSEEARERIANECEWMTIFQHRNLTKLIGTLFDKNPSVLVYDIADTLLDRLRDTEFSLDEKGRIAIGIASGMKYLHERRIIHRKLSSTTCFLERSGNATIGDFESALYLPDGLMYQAGPEEDIDQFWSAPETVANRMFHLKTDVWCFGLILWQLAANGQDLYQGQHEFEISELLADNYRMDIPNDCSLELYGTMLMCWNSDHHRRPEFKQLITSIKRTFNIYNNF